MSKYAALVTYLNAQPGTKVTRDFEEIASVVEGGLPASAYQYRAWWSNEAGGRHVQARGWLSAGWSVASVDLARRRVTFQRAS